MSSWAEPQYESRPSPTYLHPLDYPDGNMIHGAEHPPSLRTGHSFYAPRLSPNSSRQTYTSGGLYGPRPQPSSHSDPMQGYLTPVAPQRAMTELEEADDEYMEVEPEVDLGEPTYVSEFDDESPPQGKRRFVGGFIRGLRKIPKVVRRGFTSDKRELLTPPGLAYHQSPYRSPFIHDNRPHEPEEAPPYDAPAEHVEDGLLYVDNMNMPTEYDVNSTSPSRTPSQTIRAPRSESQLTYQSLTNPPARHVSQHGSLHPSPRSLPRTVRNPDPHPPSPTEESGPGTATGTSPRLLHRASHLAPESESAPRTPRLSPLERTRRPTVTIQSPTGNPEYIEPDRADDYAGMDMDDFLSSSEEGRGSEQQEQYQSSAPFQFSSRIAKFFRDLNNLPWVSPNVTVDFDPTDTERARFEHGRGPGKSWYTGHLHDLDLLGGSSTMRGLTVPSGPSLGPAPGSSATLAPPAHGSGSASSSEGHITHLPSTHTHPPYPYPMALPSHPLYFYPYPAMPQPQPQPPPPQQQQQQQQQPPPLPVPVPAPARAPDGTAEQVSPQASSQSDVPRQPYLFVVAMPPPPGYMPGPVDPSMQPAFSVPYSPPV